MPSEKLRYLVNRSGPIPPLDMQELQKKLSSFDSEHLIDLLWDRTQSDDLLRQVLMVSAVLHSSAIDSDIAKAAVDYALHFPKYVRFSENGHGQILDEVKRGVEYQVKRGNRDIAICVGQYAIEKAQQISENFEDDWEWRCSLEDLVRCVDKSGSEVART